MPFQILYHYAIQCLNTHNVNIIHICKYGIEQNAYSINNYRKVGAIMAISKVYQVSDETFIQIVSQANTYSDCLRALGLGTNGGSSTDTLKRRIAELNCDISHFG